METKRKRKIKGLLLSIPLAVLLLAAAALLLLPKLPWGFARQVPEEEKALRLSLVKAAEEWLHRAEDDGSHRDIIDLYNGHTPLAQGYAVQYTDDWCSTYASAVAIQCGLTEIIPTECGCERHIGRFMDLDSWVEDDSYFPLPGDYIFYCWTDNGLGDCTGWSSHVGIVTGTFGPWIRVIEGNYRDQVTYRYIWVDSKGIRGYGVPQYEKICQPEP